MNSYLPATYQPSYSYGGIGQQIYPTYPQTSQQTQQQAGTDMYGLIWVDGEVGAKAYQMPAGWPANKPIALWDTNDMVIYLKSTNPMGMPNPLQKARYALEELKTVNPLQKSGDTEPIKADMTEYVRKDDMERMKQELLTAIQSANVSSEPGPTRRKGSDA